MRVWQRPCRDRRRLANDRLLGKSLLLRTLPKTVSKCIPNGLLTLLSLARSRAASLEPGHSKPTRTFVTARQTFRPGGRWIPTWLPSGEKGQTRTTRTARGEDGRASLESGGVLRAEATVVDGVLVVGLALVVAYVHGRGGVDLHLALQLVAADLPLVHLQETRR